MPDTNLPPFYAGQKVVVICDYYELKRYWGFNYPDKNAIVIVQEIFKHPSYNFWLVRIASCECDLCHRGFAPLEKGFKAISLKKVLQKETPLISVN